jgi:hypothetical protein
MALSDLHSARLENIIRDALRHYRSYHTCYCPECQSAHETDDEEDGGEVEKYYEFNIRDAAKNILIALNKLEYQLEKAS